MATELDSLQIEIKANSDTAARSIDKLISALGRLNTSLNNFGSDSKYLANFQSLTNHVRDFNSAIAGIDLVRITDLSKKLASLSSSSKALAGLAQLKNIKMPEVKAEVFSDKAMSKAKEIATEYGIKDKEAVNSLTKALDTLYASVGDDKAFLSAKQNIESLIKTFSRFESAAKQGGLANIVKSIQAETLSLPKDWAKNVIIPGNLDEKQIRGLLGIKNTKNEKNYDYLNDAVQRHPEWGVDAHESTAQLQGLIDILSRYVELGGRAEMTWEEASKKGAGSFESMQSPAQMLDDTIEDLINDVSGLNGAIEKFNLQDLDATHWSEKDMAGAQGLTDFFPTEFLDAFREKLNLLKIMAEETSESLARMGDTDDFMNIDLPDEEDMLGFTEAVNEVRTAAETIVPTLQAIDNVLPKEEAINPFENITAGLQELSGIQLSDTLSNLEYVRNSITKLGGEKGTAAAANLAGVAQALQNFNFDVPTGDNFATLGSNLAQLGKKRIGDAVNYIPSISKSLTELYTTVGNVPDLKGIQELGSALSVFGRKTAETAVDAIPKLAEAFRGLISTLSTAPAINRNVIDLANAMANLAGTAKSLNPATKALGSNIRGFTNHIKSARKPTLNLAAAFGKLYASYWVLIRLGKKAFESIDLASQLTEVQNIVDQTFVDARDKMEDFAKSAVDSLGMSELTAKKIGSTFQAMGRNMSVKPSDIENTNKFVQQATDGYADVAHSMADMSINLTRLAGDMASFYNVDYEDVAKDLQSIFTGQTRPLRQYGLDLTQATLKEFALKNGLDADIRSMTQAEKMLLRYQYVLAQTTASHGDFQRTIGTWANQIRIAEERLRQLMVILGKIGVNVFKPLVTSFNNAMNDIIHLAEATLNSLGKIFGWQVEMSDVGVLDQYADGLEDIEDGYNGAGKAAKKFKAMLLGIDELNVLPDNNDNGGGGGGSANGGDSLIKYQQPALNIDMSGYESIYDTLYKLGKKIAEVEKDFLQGIKWDEIYKKFENFGEGLAQFLNGYYSNVDLFYEKGKFFANILNTIAGAIGSFFEELDGLQIGIDFGEKINGFIDNIDWVKIEKAFTEMAHDIAQFINGAFMKINWTKLGQTIAKGLNVAVKFLYTLGNEIDWKRVGNSFAKAINGFFNTFNFSNLATAISKWVKGLLNLISTAIEKTNWKLIGKKIGEFLVDLDIVGIAGKLSKVLWDIVNSALELGVSMFKAAPLETALLAVFLSPTLKTNLLKGVSALMGMVQTAMVTDVSKIGTAILANFGTSFDAIKLKVETLCGDISKILAKGIGGIAVGFLEFKAVNDIFSDLVEGSDNLALKMGELVVAVGLAGAAMTAIFGPAGVFITAAVAAAGAIAGITSALKEVNENNAMNVLTKDMGDNAVTLGQLVENFKDATNEISGALSKLNAQHDKSVELQSDLNGIANGYSMVVDAFSQGTLITGAAVETYVGDISKLKDTWADYISAKYDFLIQSEMQDYQFAKAHGELTEAEAAEYQKRIQNLILAKDDQITEMSGLVDAVGQAAKDYTQAVDQNLSLEKIASAKDAFAEATEKMLEFGSSSGDILAPMSELQQEIDGFSNSAYELTQNLSFSDLDAGNYEEFANSLMEVNTQIKEGAENAIKEVEEYKENLINSGVGEEEATKRAQMYFDDINAASKAAYDSIQLGLYDKLYSFESANNKNGIENFVNKVLNPYTKGIEDEYGKATDGLKPWISDKTYEMLEKAYGAGTKKNGELKIDVFDTLSTDWRDIFYSVRDSVAPVAEEAGYTMTESLTNKLGKAVEQGSKHMSTLNEAAESTGDAFSGGAAKIDNAANSIMQINPLAIAGGDAMKTFQNNINGLDESNINDINTAMVGVDETIGKVDETESKFGTTFSEVTGKVLGDVSSLKDSFNQMVSDFTTNASAMCEEIGTNISDWFTNSVAPWFTTEKWSGMWNDVKSGIQTKWGEFTDWWNNTGFKKWWDDSVSKWFTADQWTKVSEGMKKGLEDKWNDFANWFNNTGFANWWSKVTGFFSTKNWTFSGIKDGLTAAWDAAIAGIKGVWNTFAQWCNEHLKIEIPAVKNPLTGENLFDGTTIGIKLPMFYMGGFPEDGLFLANHGEMVGGFTNGKTAVANNEQIVEGIKRGVYEAMTQVMSNNNNSTNLVVELDGRELFNSMIAENNRAINRTGTSPLWGI